MDGACILRRLPWLLAQRPGSSTAGWGIASSQLSASLPEMGKVQSLLPASSCPKEPALGVPGGRKAITGWWGAQSFGCRTLLKGEIFAALGCQGAEDSPARLGCIFFGCTKWKILSHRENRCCEEERRAACPLQELGLEQHTPRGAELCQLWAAGEPCRHCPHPAHAGNSFYCCESPGHASWKSLKVKSPLHLPTAHPGGQGRVWCAAACLSRDNLEAAGNRPPALKTALFYNKRPARCWQVVMGKQKA